MGRYFLFHEKQNSMFGVCEDSQKKTTGGRNGYGAKLANIFSRRFIIETQDTEKGLRYKQEWQKNMGKKTEPKVALRKNCFLWDENSLWDYWNKKRKRLYARYILSGFQEV